MSHSISPLLTFYIVSLSTINIGALLLTTFQTSLGFISFSTMSFPWSTTQSMLWVAWLHSLLWYMTVSPSFLAFYDLDSLEEHWPGYPIQHPPHHPLFWVCLMFSSQFDWSHGIWKEYACGEAPILSCTLEALWCPCDITDSINLGYGHVGHISLLKVIIFPFL